jgi:hypothetical protein
MRMRIMPLKELLNLGNAATLGLAIMAGYGLLVEAEGAVDGAELTAAESCLQIGAGTFKGVQVPVRSFVKDGAVVADIVPGDQVADGGAQGSKDVMRAAAVGQNAVFPTLAAAQPPGHERAGGDGKQNRHDSLRQPGLSFHDFLLQCIVAVVTSFITTIAVNKLLDRLWGHHTTRGEIGQ